MTTTTIATSLGSSIAGFDVFILAAFLAGAALLGLSLGRVRVIGMIVAAYIAFAMAVFVPFLSAIAHAMHAPDSYAKLAVFFLFFALTFVQFFRRHIFSGFSSGSAWWQTSLLSVLQVGLLISLTLSLLPPEMAEGLSGLTKSAFLSDIGRGIWLASPLLAVLFLPNG